MSIERAPANPATRELLLKLTKTDSRLRTHCPYYNKATLDTWFDLEKLPVVFLCRSDGEVVGCCIIALDETEPENLAFRDIYYIKVAPEHTRKNFASEILREVIAHLKAQGDLKRVKACCYQDNEPANHLFLKHGFSQRLVEMAGKATENYFEYILKLDSAM